MDLTSTRVPEVVDALVASWTTELPAVKVYDGPQPATEEPVDVIVIGVGNVEDADPYRTERVDGSFDLGGRSKETGIIRCQATTWFGDTDLSTLRAKLGGWLATIEAAFRTDQQLSRTCDRARIGSVRWYQVQETQGAGVGIDFNVEYEAWL